MSEDLSSHLAPPPSPRAGFKFVPHFIDYNLRPDGNYPERRRLASPDYRISMVPLAVGSLPSPSSSSSPHLSGDGEGSDDVQSRRDQVSDFMPSPPYDVDGRGKAELEDLLDAVGTPISSQFPRFDGVQADSFVFEAINGHQHEISPLAGTPTSHYQISPVRYLSSSAVVVM
jgi:hypothetical protein